MSKKSKSECLVDTCANPQPSSRFTVGSGYARLLQLCGDIEGLGGATLPIEQVVAVDGEACVGPVVIGGEVMELSGETTVLAMTIPGTFQIDASAVPEGVCVKVCGEPIDQHTACCIPKPF